MAHDHYKILGVDSTASRGDIKKAFRRKVMECHPDRGGSHAEMILVIEAWNALSDPVLRRQYDSARLRNAEEAEAVGNAARKSAAEYPRKWSDFEVWLNEVTNDISSAHHGSSSLHDVWRLPTVANSYSGRAFIGLGAIAGAIFGGVVILNLVPPERHAPQQREKLPIILAAIGGFGGAWMGAWLHRGLKATLKNTAGSADPQASSDGVHQIDVKRKDCQALPSATRILACERCGQKLRVPEMESELIVTCRSCGHKFSSQPQGSSSQGVG